MNEMVVKEYLGNGITFKMIEGQIYADATEMAKIFDGGIQKLANWKRSEKTKELLSELKEINDMQNLHIEFIISDRGGMDSGRTWIHETLVLDFSQYLNIKFKVWCQTQLTTLLREGSVSLKPVNPLDMLLTMDKESLAMTCLQLTTIVKEKDEIIEQKETKLIEQAPKVEFADTLLKSKANVLIGDFAKVLNSENMNIGSNRLFEWLRENEYLYKDKKGNNLPYQTYVDKGYFVVKENVIDSAFKTFITFTTLITPNGQVYLYNKLKNIEKFNKK